MAVLARCGLAFFCVRYRGAACPEQTEAAAVRQILAWIESIIDSADAISITQA